MKLFVFPGNIETEILSIGARQVPYARTSSFGDLVLSCEQDLLRLTDCGGGRVIPFTASGTAAMESVVANMIGINDRVLVIDGGTFGRRWADLVSLYPHAKMDVCQLAQTPNYDEVEKMIRSGSYDAVLMQHHETSTGELFDVARIGAACREVGSICVVDAIGSFLADPFSMDAMCVDIAILSSHKGLCLPPGLSFVVLNSKALSCPMYGRGLYLDFEKNLKSLQRGQTLFSPAALLFAQLRQRLDHTLSVSETIKSVEEKAHAFRECLRRDGRKMIPYTASNCLTSFRVDCDARQLCGLLENEGWFVMPSKQADQLRVAHLGLSSVLDHQKLYEKICAVEQSLKSD